VVAPLETAALRGDFIPNCVLLSTRH